MINEELNAFIQESLKLGRSIFAITNDLIENGWNEVDIQTAVLQVQQEIAAASTPSNINSSAKNRRNFFSSRKFYFLVGTIMILVLISGSVYFYVTKRKATQLQTADSSAITQTKTERLKNVIQAAADIEAKQFTEAIAILTLNTNQDAKDAESFVLRGIAKLRSGDIYGGVADLTHALENKKDNAYDRPAYYFLGVAQIDLTTKVTNFTEAIGSPKATTSGLEVTDEEIYSKRAFANLQLKNMTEALADLNSVININPNYESALIFRAYIESQIGNLKAACTDATNGRDTSDPQVKAGELRTQIITMACGK